MQLCHCNRYILFLVPLTTTLRATKATTSVAPAVVKELISIVHKGNIAVTFFQYINLLLCERCSVPLQFLLQLEPQLCLVLIGWRGRCVVFYADWLWKLCWEQKNENDQGLMSLNWDLVSCFYIYGANNVDIKTKTFLQGFCKTYGYKISYTNQPLFRFCDNKIFINVSCF